jgi:hypothetical protein
VSSGDTPTDRRGVGEKMAGVVIRLLSVGMLSGY